MDGTSRAERLALRLESEVGELRALVPELEAQLAGAREEMGKADVVRRHMARNPEKFSPHERENVFEDVQARAMRQQKGAQDAERALCPAPAAKKSHSQKR